MTNGRKRTASFLATLCIASMGGTILAASPTFAEPELEEVQQKVDTLYEQAEQASERYNDARIELKQTKSRLSALRPLPRVGSGAQVDRARNVLVGVGGVDHFGWPLQRSRACAEVRRYS